jgi:cytochrome b
VPRCIEDEREEKSRDPSVTHRTVDPKPLELTSKLPVDRGTVRVWDLPTRLIHVVLIASVTGAWLTRGGEHMDWHLVFGYAASAAVVFRLLWGFAGPQHSRFASFRYSIKDAIRYLSAARRGAANHYTGHNPAGSWSIYLILGAVALTCVSGFIAVGALYQMGPVRVDIPFPLGDRILSVHEAGAWVVLILAVLHIVGAVWGSRVHHENLILAMITGRKEEHEASGAREAPRNTLAAALIALSCAAFALWYLHWHVPAEVAKRVAVEQVEDKKISATLWSRECSSCHLAYSPALLPARSWDRVLAEQEHHFGEDLGLAPKTIQQLASAARQPALSWPAWMLAGSASLVEPPPIRVSELPAWKHLHRNVEPTLVSAKTAASSGGHDCERCHDDALSALFHPRLIHIREGKEVR